MAVPQYFELFNPTLKAVRALGGSASISEIVEGVTSDIELTPEDAEFTRPNGRAPEIVYRLSWARSYLKKFGLLNNSTRGVWSLTERGRETQEVDPQEVVRVVQALVREQQRASAEVAADSDEPTEVVEDDEDEWRSDLLDTLLEMDPAAFERLSQRLLRESGFLQVEVTGRSGDGGIDGKGIVRVANVLSFPIIFQCKRVRGTVGSSVVRDFRGAMIGRADKGVIITTGSFSRDARLEASRDGAPAIDLVDGDLLVQMLKDLSLGVETRSRVVEDVEIDKDWFRSI